MIFRVANALMLTALLGIAARAELRDASAMDAPPMDAPPNIVLIMADDVGRECFGCYGSQEYKTPNIDRLAAQGMRFTQCHSCPLCTPSRVKLMTGKSNVRNYVAFSILDRHEPTFAHALRRAGYQTAVAGKWQLFGAEHYGDMAAAGSTPGGAGFDEHCLWQVDKLGPRYWKPKLVKNGQYLETRADDYGPTLCTDFICDFIRRKKASPFLIYYPMILPHNPFQPTPDSPDRDSDNKKQNFVDMVGYVDKMVGRIAKQLDDAGVRDNTLLMFLADNGTNRNIRSKLGDRIVRGGKGLTIDDGTHVPLVASWPAVMPQPSVCQDLIDLSDFLPTMLDVARVERPAAQPLDGISFFPQLCGESNPSARRAIYCYYNPRPGSPRYPQPVIYARDQRWKLYADGRLFEVGSDRLEQRPISADQSPDAAAARERLQQVIASMPPRGLKIRKTDNSR